MKRLIFILMLCVPLMGYARISITKEGNLMKVTGLVMGESKLLTANGQPIYVGNITRVLTNGNVIIFYRDDQALLTIRYADLTTKFGQSNSIGIVEYLITNTFI